MEGSVDLKKIPTKENLTDVLTSQSMLKNLYGVDPLVT